MASYTPEEIKGYAKSQGWLNDYGYLKDAQSLAAARSAANQFGVSVGDLESALGYNSGAIANYTQPVTQAATSGAQKTGPYSASDIKGYAQAQGWLNDQGKVKDDASAAAMQQAARQYGVSGTQIENALGYDSGVVNRYLATHGLGLLPGGMNGIGSTLGDSTQPGVPYQQSPAPNAAISNAIGIVNSQTQRPPPAAAQVPGPAPIVFSPQSVNQSQTTQGILSQLLADGSPVMQRAKAIAMEDMAGRGLTSSSIATDAGMRAIVDRATDIAGRDAGIYADQALQNQRAQYDVLTGNANRELQAQTFNAGAQNTAANLGFDAGSRRDLAVTQATLEMAGIPLKTQAQMQIMATAQGLDLDKMAAAHGYDAQKMQQAFANNAELTRLSSGLDAQSRATLQELQAKLQGSLSGQASVISTTQRYTDMAQKIRVDPDLPDDVKRATIADLQYDWRAEISRISAISGAVLPADYFPG